MALTPNHWHFALWTEQDGQPQAFVAWLTHTDTLRFYAHRHTAATGHVYRGRFKNFPVQNNQHLLTLGRQAERNPLPAERFARAQRLARCGPSRPGAQNGPQRSRPALIGK